MEVWKDILHRPRYQASTEGRIRNSKNGRILTQRPTKKGYLEVRVAFGGRKSGLTQTVHKLVMWAFKPEKGKNTQVNHKNGVKSDNRPDNLEWCTNGQNGKHAYDTGLKPKLTGERNGRARLNWDQVKEIRSKYTKKYGALIAIAREYNVDPITINYIITNKTWKTNV